MPMTKSKSKKMAGEPYQEAIAANITKMQKCIDEAQQLVRQAQKQAGIDTLRAIEGQPHMDDQTQFNLIKGFCEVEVITLFLDTGEAFPRAVYTKLYAGYVEASAKITLYSYDDIHIFFEVFSLKTGVLPIFTEYDVAVAAAKLSI